LHAARCGSIATPSFDLKGEIVVLNPEHELYGQAAATLALDKPQSQQRRMISEMEIAQILDYPVPLDMCDASGRMIEIGYFEQNHLVTSYCALDSPGHRYKIKVHFQRYKRELGTMFPLCIKISILS
jgi:hypothetical protein